MVTFHVLVVAQQTATSAELVTAMQERAARSPVAFTLLMPFPPAVPLLTARSTLDKALTVLRDSGLDVSGTVGHGQPLEVVQETWDPRLWDEVIVATLPERLSSWLQIDLPHRIARMTGVHVTHVIAAAPRPRFAPTPPPHHEAPGVLAPLAPMAWTGRH